MKYKKYTIEQKRDMKRRYRERTGSGKFGYKKWEPEEDNIILYSDLSDRELGMMLRRSVGSIQHRRSRLKGGS